jgi:hypothetical protein
MFFTRQLNIEDVLHPVRFAMLVAVVAVSQLAGCGGGGSSSNVIPSASIESSPPASSGSATSTSSPAPSGSAPSTSSPVPATGSFTLRWTAPTTRSDGSPLSLADIDGFRIHYGASRGYYPNSIDLRDGTSQSAVVENVPVGNYYVVMTTYDVNGLESGYSSAITKNVF